MNLKIKRVILIIAIFLNCATIFYFSNQVANTSSKQSSRVVEIVSNIFPIIKNMEEQQKTYIKENILTPIVRKTAHFSIYTMLGILTTNFMITIKNKEMYQIFIYALIFCAFYAVTDEFHQSFIPGRSAEIRDVLIDFSGALVGVLFTIGITKLTRKIKQKKNIKI